MLANNARDSILLLAAKINQAKLASTLKFLDSGTLVDAFMWFTENIDSDHVHRNEIFFYLRNRYRNEVQPC